MRLLPLISALIVMIALYFVVFERDRLVQLAGGAPDEAPQSAPLDAETETVADAAAPAAAPETAAPQTVAQRSQGETVQRVSVVAIESRADVVDRAVLLRGRTEAARDVTVQAETSGRIVSEPLRKGTFVNAGDLMCEIEPGTREATLAEARARLAEARAGLPVADARVSEAKARLAEAEINNNAAARLSQGGFASDTRVASTEASLEAARASIESASSGRESAQAGVQAAEASVALAEREIERLEIRAPFDGLLETDTAELGELMQPGSPCGTLIQLDPIKLVGFVPETQVGRVNVGALAGARLISGDEVAGQVTFLSRSADPETRTFRVEIQVPNPDLSIRDGQTAEIAISSDGAAAHLVPASALTLDDQGVLGLRIIEEDAEKGDVAGFRPITLISDSAEGVFVTGLPDVARVITVGQEYVTDGVPVEGHAARSETLTQ